MKVEITRENIINFYEILERLVGDFDLKFSFLIERNLENLAEEYKSITSTRNKAQPTERYNEFQEKRMALVLTYCSRNPGNNEPITNGAGEFLFEGDNGVIFQNKFKELSAEYAEDIITFDMKVNQLTELLEEKIEVEIFQLPFKYFPKHVDSVAFKMLTKYACTSTLDEIESLIFADENEEEVSEEFVEEELPQLGE